MYHCLYFPQDLRDPLEQISDSKKQEEKEKAALQSNIERYEKNYGTNLNWKVSHEVLLDDQDLEQCLPKWFLKVSPNQIKATALL